MSYYLAPSLAVLRDEINARWPDRDRTSDGWIGDTAHQATRSDHNPNDRGSVNALDIDRDGVDVPAILAAVEQHPAAHYWIFNRQIADADDGWRPRPYTGSNPHDKHLHVSIRQTRAAEQETQPWLEDIVTPAQFLKILQDPAVARTMRALPWQYVGGGIPPGKSTLNVLNDLFVTAERTAERVGVDQVDEAAIVAGVLAGLTPAAIAAAIPPTLAQQVVDELSARLAAGT